MASTLRDVATMAGVSVATASRYINKSGFVSQDAGQRLQTAIDALGYLPNLVAGALVRQRSQLVAVLVPQLAQSLFNGTIDALVEALAANGYTAILGLTGPDEERMGTVVDAALGRRVEAIIVTGEIRDEGLRSRLRSADVTVIETWGLPADPIDIAVGFSHPDVGRDVARFLAERGYARPFLLTTRASRARLRRDGFCSEWDAIRGTPVGDEEVDPPSTFGKARGIFRRLRAAGEMPDVIFCGSDGLAQGMVIEAATAGLQIPDEVAIMGFGDLAVAAHMRPSLTTVAIDGRKIGQEAANILRLRNAGAEPADRRIDVGFNIVARESA